MALGRRRSVVDARKAGSIEAALRRSLRAAVAHDWETAETWLERIVEADSADLDAYHALARLYREQGAIGRAIRMHQNLLLRADLDRAQRTDALLELARDFDAGGFSERAAAGYEEVLDASPKHAESLARLIALLHETREFPRALALVKRFRRIDAENADAAEIALLLSVAQAQVDEGDADGARTTLKRALRRYKTCASAWMMLGEIEAERGRDAKAIGAWQRAVNADTNLAAALYPKIEAGFAARGKLKEFEKWLRGIVQNRPADVVTRIALSRLQKGRGEAREAIEELARAIDVTPNEHALHVEIGRQLLESDLEAEALKAYSSLIDVLANGLLDRRPRDVPPVAPNGDVKP